MQPVGACFGVALGWGLIVSSILFYFSHPIYFIYLPSFFISLFYSRDSDPGSPSMLFSAHPDDGSRLAFYSRGDLSFCLTLVDSR